MTDEQRPHDRDKAFATLVDYYRSKGVDVTVERTDSGYAVQFQGYSDDQAGRNALAAAYHEANIDELDHDHSSCWCCCITCEHTNPYWPPEGGRCTDTNS